MKVTYYLDLLSHWCHRTEPAWATLKTRYAAGQVDFQWKIAAMSPGDVAVSTAQVEWFYRRSSAVMNSPEPLNPGWLEPERKGVYPAPSLVAEAARDFLPHPEDDRVRLALALAALREGQKIGDLALSISIATKAAKVDASRLRAVAESPAVAARIAASTAEFHAHKIGQRPAFILENTIGDKAVFSGLTRAEPLAAAIDAMLADASFAARFGSVPPT